MDDADGTPPVLNTVRQHAEKHPAFPQGSLRALIFNAKTRETSKGVIEGNGFDQAVVRVGRKILINERRFFEWVEKQGSGITRIDARKNVMEEL